MRALPPVFATFIALIPLGPTWGQQPPPGQFAALPNGAVEATAAARMARVVQEIYAPVATKNPTRNFILRVDLEFPTTPFSAEWTRPFDERSTRARPFRLANGGSVLAAQMHQTGYLRVAASGLYTLAELGLGDSGLSVVFAFSHGPGGLPSLASNLEEALALAWSPLPGPNEQGEIVLTADFAKHFIERDMPLHVPRFTFESGLYVALDEQGMRFDSKKPASRTTRQLTVDQSSPDLASPRAQQGTHPFAFFIHDGRRVLTIGQVASPLPVRPEAIQASAEPATSPPTSQERTWRDATPEEWKRLRQAMGRQITAMESSRANFNAVERKVNPMLVFEWRMRHGLPAGEGLPTIPRTGIAVAPDGTTRVDMLVEPPGARTDVLARVGALGGTVEDSRAVDDDTWFVRCRLPIDMLMTLAEHENVTAIGESIEYPIELNAGPVVTEGIQAHLADVGPLFGVDGTGVTVAVISDGVNFFDDDDPVARGELPAPRILPCGGQPQPGSMARSAAGTGNEGLAISEIIHDIAPGAKIVFTSVIVNPPPMPSNASEMMVGSTSPSRATPETSSQAPRRSSRGLLSEVTPYSMATARKIPSTSVALRSARETSTSSRVEIKLSRSSKTREGRSIFNGTNRTIRARRTMEFASR